MSHGKFTCSLETHDAVVIEHCDHNHRALVPAKNCARRMLKDDQLRDLHVVIFHAHAGWAGIAEIAKSA